MTSFDGYEYRDEILRYTHRIVADIRQKKKREAVREEYAAHIEDAMTARMLAGMGEKEAFSAVCEEMGNVTLLSEMLSATHNRDPLPSFVKWLLWGTGIGGIIASYILIENRVYRSWVALLFQLTLLGFGIYGIYLLYRVRHCLRARKATLKKLCAFAKENGLQITVQKRGLRGVFAPSEHADVTIDTPTHRYVLSLWGTFLGKRHLHLMDIGLYMHSAVVGYANLFTRVNLLFHNGYFMALPKGMAYFSLFHTNLVDVPKGMHLLPKVAWEKAEHPERKNVRVLLLSPVPFKTSALVSGRENEMLDGDLFEGAHVYSTVGFLSYLNGERIATNGTFRRKEK